MQTAIFLPPQAPAPSGPGPGIGIDVAPAPGASAGATRLHRLFRASLRAGQVHPLWRLLHANASREPVAPIVAAPAGPGPALPKLLPEQVRRRVAELPPLPQAALRALQTLRRADASLEQVALELACDASLTARILRLANSPFYGVPGRVSSARDAAQVLGRRTLESMLTLAAVAGQFEGQRSRNFDASAFWRHALASAIAARGLARGAGLDEDKAFAAALLHDIGLLAMSVYFPEALDGLVGQARIEDVDLSSVERGHGLTPHAEVGAWIAAHWNFPAAVVQVIAAHHAPATAPADVASLAACVHVANAIAHALDVAGLAHELVPMVDALAWQRVALGDDAMHQLFEETTSGVRALCVALAL